jgi:hypothetical protein
MKPLRWAIIGIAAVATALLGSFWVAGSVVKRIYDQAYARLPNTAPFVQVVSRNYHRGFLFHVKHQRL